MQTTESILFLLFDEHLNVYQTGNTPKGQALQLEVNIATAQNWKGLNVQAHFVNVETRKKYVLYIDKLPQVIEIDKGSYNIHIEGTGQGTQLKTNTKQVELGIYKDDQLQGVG